MEVRDVSRRQLLAGGGLIGAGGLVLGGLAGYEWPHPTPAAPSPAPAPATPNDTRGVLHFVTRGDLNPPAVTIPQRYSQSAAAGDPPYIFLAPGGYPVTGPGDPGLMIMRRNGEIVWFSPNTGLPASNGSGRKGLQVQSYHGKPVLTWWEGRVTYGYGAEGKAVIADGSYRTIATISAGRGLPVDLHEFVTTGQDTALIPAYRAASADLSALGGPKQGMAMSGVVQEIDIASGRVLFEWDSLDHVPVADSYAQVDSQAKAPPFDYFHLNSIAVAPDGDLLVSARNTCTVYKVARPGGEVRWRLGGKNSSFQMGPGATFWWQHHARPHGAGLVSIFDNGASPAKEPQSRAILLDLDTTAMRATLKRSYTHPAGLLAANQGSMQPLPDGRVFVGWGNLPYFSEFAEDGTLIMDGHFPIGDQSYRVFTADWTGHPAGKPAIVAEANPAGGSVVYASWNGATELDSWTVLAGSSAGGLTKVGSQPRSGFETAITVNTTGPYFAVIANDASGHALSQSATVHIASG